MSFSLINWIKRFFSYIYNKVKSFFSHRTAYTEPLEFKDLESQKTERSETMDPLVFDYEDEGVTEDSTTYFNNDKSKEFKQNSADAEKYSTDSDDVIEKSGILDHFRESCKVKTTVDYDFEDLEDNSKEVKKSSSGDEADKEIVELEEVDIDNIAVELESLVDEEDFSLPTGNEQESESDKKGKKPIGTKLKWEPKPSVPRYSLSLNSKLNSEDIKKTPITTKGKASVLAKAKMESNQSKFKEVKDVFKKEILEKKNADAIARAAKVEAERKRVAEAKKKKEEQEKKMKQQAHERYLREKELRNKHQLEFELKKEEICKARLEALKTSKNVPTS